MTRESFTVYRPRTETLNVIRQANAIIRSFKEDGLTMTLRQLYYQFVARDLIENSDRSYKRLGSIFANARLGALMDWDAIEDRIRQPVIWQEDETAESAVERALASFRLPRHAGQSTYVELWVEKDALAGVLEPLAMEYHVTLMVNRGYSSVSAMKSAADRIRARCIEYGSESAAILYLGDLDPSGEDMVRDIRERCGMFLAGGIEVTMNGAKAVLEDEASTIKRCPDIDLVVEKLALTMDQVREHDPPPNPAKLSDSRAKAYIAKYGRESWEVDALPPPVLRTIIRKGFENYIDLDLIEQRKDEEDVERDRVRKLMGAVAG